MKFVDDLVEVVNRAREQRLSREPGTCRAAPKHQRGQSAGDQRQLRDEPKQLVNDRWEGDDPRRSQGDEAGDPLRMLDGVGERDSPALRKANECNSG